MTHHSFLIYLFQFLACFAYPCAHHQENQLSISTLDTHLHRVTYTRSYINTIDSPADEHSVARNMQRIGINIYEKRTVRQVGNLQEFNRDAPSTKHKILQSGCLTILITGALDQ
jgi:hypothetical protein